MISVENQLQNNTTKTDKWKIDEKVNYYQLLNHKNTNKTLINESNYLEMTTLKNKPQSLSKNSNKYLMRI